MWIRRLTSRSPTSTSISVRTSSPKCSRGRNRGRVSYILPCGPNGEDKGGWDQETIAELTAEYRRQTNIRGYTVSRWYKRTGRPNHRLDCAVYALAALALSRLKIDDCELQRVEARNVGRKEPEENARPAELGRPEDGRLRYPRAWWCDGIRSGT